MIVEEAIVPPSAFSFPHYHGKPLRRVGEAGSHPTMLYQCDLFNVVPDIRVVGHYQPMML